MFFIFHVDVLVSQYTDGLSSREMHTRCCSSLALGCLPRFMIHSKLKQVCCDISAPQYVTVRLCACVCACVFLNVFACCRSWKASSRCAATRRRVSLRHGGMQFEQSLSEYPYISLFSLAVRVHVYLMKTHPSLLSSLFCLC